MCCLLSLSKSSPNDFHFHLIKTRTHCASWSPGTSLPRPFYSPSIQWSHPSLSAHPQIYQLWPQTRDFVLAVPPTGPCFSDLCLNFDPYKMPSIPLNTTAFPSPQLLHQCFFSSLYLWCRMLCVLNLLKCLIVLTFFILLESNLFAGRNFSSLGHCCQPHSGLIKRYIVKVVCIIVNFLIVMLQRQKKWSNWNWF